MRLFDCTLRDGANVVGNGFSEELTVSITKALLECGIDNIELGNAKGIGAYDDGAEAPLTDEGYMDAVAPFTGKGNLGMFLQVKYADEKRVMQAKEKGLSFLRVGTAAGDGESALKAVRMVKDAGLTCRYSLMKAYLLTPGQLAEEAYMLQEAGVDIITIMDSAGTMLPEEVTEYTAAMTEKLSIPVGFHGHSNMGMAQANALAAVSAGAEEIDCGLLGMARSAGNCSTEIAAASFMRQTGEEPADFYRLLSYLDEELIPAMEKYDYRPAVKPLDLVLGISGCHSSFTPRFEKAAEAAGVSKYKLIVEVSKSERKNPSEELINETAEKLAAAK